MRVQRCQLVPGGTWAPVHHDRDWGFIPTCLFKMLTCATRSYKARLPGALMELMAIRAACCQMYCCSLSWCLWYCTSDSFSQQKVTRQNHGKSRGLTKRKKHHCGLMYLCMAALYRVQLLCLCLRSAKHTGIKHKYFIFSTKFSSTKIRLLHTRLKSETWGD